jgi:predicted amidophosphoribosyltransferase
MLRAALDLVLPGLCAGCGERSGHAACASCLARLGPPRVGPGPAGVPVLVSCADWADEARRLVLAFKERGRVGLVGALGAALAAAVEVLEPGRAALSLVPVPSRPAARRERGHDPTARLATAAARALRRRGRGVQVAPVLSHCRAVRDQAGLSAAARRANLTGALRAGRFGALPTTVVLLDDVSTTGATLAEAARALREAGITPLGAVVLGRALPPGGRTDAETRDERPLA